MDQLTPEEPIGQDLYKPENVIDWIKTTQPDGSPGGTTFFFSKSLGNQRDETTGKKIERNLIGTITRTSEDPQKVGRSIPLIVPSFGLYSESGRHRFGSKKPKTTLVMTGLKGPLEVFEGDCGRFLGRFTGDKIEDHQDDIKSAIASTTSLRPCDVEFLEQLEKRGQSKGKGLFGPSDKQKQKEKAFKAYLEYQNSQRPEEQEQKDSGYEIENPLFGLRNGEAAPDQAPLQSSMPIDVEAMKRFSLACPVPLKGGAKPDRPSQSTGSPSVGEGEVSKIARKPSPRSSRSPRSPK